MTSPFEWFGFENRSLLGFSMIQQVLFFLTLHNIHNASGNGAFYGL